MNDFTDPRQKIGTLSEWIKDGEELEDSRSISHSILIICWAPDPEGAFGTYQISGVKGYHSRETIASFLTAFYAQEHPKSIYGNLNVIVAGNNWATGRELGSHLRKLSKRHTFSVFYTGGWGFQKAVLKEEPPPRLKIIKAAFDEVVTTPPASSPKEKAKSPERPLPDVKDGVWAIPLRYWAHLSPALDGMGGFNFLCEVSKLGPNVDEHEGLPKKFKTGDLKVLEILTGDKERFPVLETLNTLRVEGCEGLELGDRVIVLVDSEPYEGGYVINHHQGTNCILGHRLIRKDEAHDEILQEKWQKSEARLIALLKTGKTSIAKATPDDLRTLSVIDPHGVREALIRERELRNLSQDAKRKAK